MLREHVIEIFLRFVWTFYGFNNDSFDDLILEVVISCSFSIILPVQLCLIETL